MKFNRTDHGDETTLAIEGTLDALTAAEFRPVIDELVEQGRKRVIVDLSQLQLIDSSGVGVIVALYKRIRAAGGKVSVTGMRDQPLQIFKLLRMDRVFAS